MSKMINCAQCSEEISAQAKTCPKCGAKVKKPFYKKWWVWLLAVIVIGSIAGGGGDDSGTTSVSNSKTKEEIVYNINDIIKTKKFEINVFSAETAKSVGSQYLSTEAAEGGIYVMVRWECKNISDEPVSSFSLPTVRLVDSKGVKYDADINATSYYETEVDPNAKILSDLNPKIKINDAAVFEVSEEAYNEGGFSLIVNADKDFKVKIN